MLLPLEWRPFFCLAAEEARNLGVFELNGERVGPHVLLRPRLAVLPMGWTHALYFCQTIHERAIARAIPGVFLLEDHAPMPCVQRGFASVCVNNFAFIGSREADVRSLPARRFAGLGSTPTRTLTASPVAALSG